MRTDKNILVIGALYVAVSIILGAFAAHALKAYLEPSSIESFKTGVDYARFHGIALMVIALIPNHFLSVKQKGIVALMILIGSLMFSVSIYLLAMNNVWQIQWIRILGPVTPIGGLTMILGWFLLAHFIFYSLKK